MALSNAGLIPLTSMMRMNDEAIYYSALHQSVFLGYDSHQFLSYYSAVVTSFNSLKKVTKLIALIIDSDAPWYKAPDVVQPIISCKPPRNPKPISIFDRDTCPTYPPGYTLTKEQLQQVFSSPPNVNLEDKIQSLYNATPIQPPAASPILDNITIQIDEAIQYRSDLDKFHGPYLEPLYCDPTIQPFDQSSPCEWLFGTTPDYSDLMEDISAPQAGPSSNKPLKDSWSSDYSTTPASGSLNDSWSSDYSYEPKKPNSKSEVVSPRESSELHSVDFPAFNVYKSRSSEKRNLKLSIKLIKEIIEQRKREKRITNLRLAQRRNKLTKWEGEHPSNRIVSHNNRRLEKFLESKDVIKPNGLLKKMFIGCCSPKDDQIYTFLTTSCHLDEITALALTPVIKAIKRLLVNKVTIGIAMCILAYYLAKVVKLPVEFFGPVIALILAYLLTNFSQQLHSAVVSLYNTCCKAWNNAKEDSTHMTDMEINEESFKYIDEAIVENALRCNADPTYPWKRQLIGFCMHHQLTNPRQKFHMTIPEHIYVFLSVIDGTKLDPRFLQDLFQETAPNGITEYCTIITDQVKSVFAGVGLISETFQLPSAVHFYTSSKRFIKHLYEMFKDLYPYVYEFVTGEPYVPPEIAKYVAIFGDISKKVHDTLKTSRESNIVKEDAKFRLRIVLEYEQLLEAQMKLLMLKAPPTYMTPMNNLIREMSTLANECYSRARGEANRDEPVLVFLRGPPGVGKTTVAHSMALIIAERLKITIDPRVDFFQREQGVEHWDGYENQMFVMFDDAFQLTDPVKQAATILEVIKCKNTAPYKLTMAALEAKKNSFFNSKFIFISTNAPNVICDQIEDIGAFYRRIDFDVEFDTNIKPPLNADGSLNFNYKIKVNGKQSDISILADSAIAVYKEREVSDKNVSAAMLKFAKTVPITPIQNLIRARNSVKDFQGVDHAKNKVRPNGLIEIVKRKYEQAKSSVSNITQNVNTFVQAKIKAFVHRPGMEQRFNDVACVQRDVTSFAQKYGKFVAQFAIGYAAMTLLFKLIKAMTTTLYPNSKKTKDTLTGDRVAHVAQSKDSIRAQLKAAQSVIDSKMLHKQPKANSSSTRWSEAMISYIKEQGWDNQAWVSESLSKIQFFEEFDCTTQEKSDLNALKTNIVEIYTYYAYKDEVHKMFGRGLILSQDTLITTSHQLPVNCEIQKLEINLAGKILETKVQSVDRIPDSDTCVVKLTALLPCRDLNYMFSPLSEITSNEAPVYLLRNFDDVLTICPIDEFKVIDRVITYKTEYDEIINCGQIFQSKVAVCPGDSGCFYVVREHGRFKIIGMHVASGFYFANGRLISREMLSKHIKPPRVAKTPFEFVKQAISDGSKSFDEIIAVNSKCIPIGIVEPRSMISNRSKINRSVLYKDEELPHPDEFPAHLKRTYNDEDPLLKANSKFRIRTEPDIEPELKEEIILALLDEHPNTPTKCFYSNLEAVEGNSDMPHINFKTATGYPESTQGKSPKERLTVEDWKRIAHETDEMLEDLYNGHVPQSIFQTSFKDETRVRLKVTCPRVINCAPTKLTMLFRRVLGPWMNMVHKSHNSIRTKVGINAHGDDWTILFDKLVSISPNIVELDYSGYEYNHPQFGYSIAAEFIFRLYIRSGFTQRDAKAAKLLIESCAGGFVLQNSCLIFVWMLLSGLPITAELNSLLNEIYQMIAYKKLVDKPLISMTDLVQSCYYGDDLLHSVSDSISDKFNSKTISKFCEDFLSMKVTPASNKTGEIPEFVNILECSFLCRKFAPRENRVDAPLKLSSITNSLQYYIPVAHMTQRELLTAKCRSFLYEMTHYPKEFYDFWLAKMSNIKFKHHLNFIAFDYPTALQRRLKLTDMD